MCLAVPYLVSMPNVWHHWPITWVTFWEESFMPRAGYN